MEGLSICPPQGFYNLWKLSVYLNYRNYSKHDHLPDHSLHRLHGNSIQRFLWQHTRIHIPQHLRVLRRHSDQDTWRNNPLSKTFGKDPWSLWKYWLWFPAQPNHRYCQLSLCPCYNRGFPDHLCSYHHWARDYEENIGWHLHLHHCYDLLIRTLWCRHLQRLSTLHHFIQEWYALNFRAEWRRLHR